MIRHYKFGHCIVNILSDCNIVGDQLTTEYGLLQIDSAIHHDIEINISISKASGITKNTTSKPYQVIRAFNRAVAVEFTDINNVDVYIRILPFSGNLHKLVNSHYEDRITACIVDFFHNTFLGILQLCIAREHQVLFHAGGVLLGEDADAILLFGSAQSGKSTFVDLLSMKYEAKVISEDFCILGSNGEVYALPHQARVSHDKYREIKQGNLSIGEILNILICRLTKRKVQRRLPFKDIYSGRQLVMKSNVSQIYFLKRVGNTVHKEKCDKDTFVKECVVVLENEFRNFVGFSETLKILQANELWQGTWQNMIDDTKSILSDVYDNVDCSILYVPIYETVDEVVERLYGFMVGENS